jgi:hypothetical protein
MASSRDFFLLVKSMAENVKEYKVSFDYHIKRDYDEGPDGMFFSRAQDDNIDQRANAQSISLAYIVDKLHPLGDEALQLAMCFRDGSDYVVERLYLAIENGSDGTVMIDEG